MDNTTLPQNLADKVFQLQFDGDNFSSKLNQVQSFWPLHNYTKEIRILNRIDIIISDKNFLKDVESGKVTPERNDIFEARLEIKEETYKIIQILKHTKNAKMKFNDV